MEKPSSFGEWLLPQKHFLLNGAERSCLLPQLWPLKGRDTCKRPQLAGLVAERQARAFGAAGLCPAPHYWGRQNRCLRKVLTWDKK